MRGFPFALTVLFLACACRPLASPASSGPAAAPLLTPQQTIALPKVGGRIDHMCLSPDGKRLYIAALGNDSLEVVDLGRGAHVAGIPGVHEAQGVAWLPESGRLAAASGHDNECRFYDADLKQTGVIHDLEDADNMRRDAGAGLLYVGHGDGALAVVDAFKCQKLADITLAGHPEAFEVEAKGGRIYVNVPSARQIAVVDKAKRTVVATWPLEDVRSNFPMALDEADHRLFVGCRHPAKLLVIDTESGKRVATLDCCGDADDVFVDRAHGRIYLTGGDGAISVFARTDADHYSLAATLQTASGARTSLFDPASGKLFVAVPHRLGHQAEIRVFQTNP